MVGDLPDGGGAIGPARHGTERSVTIRFVLFCLAASIVAATGGSFRADMPGLVVMRPALMLCLGAMLLVRGGWATRELRAPVILFALFAATMLVQLVPVPVGWWLTLAGRARYAPGVAASGARMLPLSLDPDRTVNSLLALLPAAMVIVAYAGMDDRRRRATLWVMLALSAASAAVGLAELVTGADAGMYGAAEDRGVLTGFFTNRNHQAVMLAITPPALAAMARRMAGRRGRHWSALLAAPALLTVPLVLLTGSRQGTILGLAGLMAGALAWPWPRGVSRVGRGLSVGGVVLAAAALVAIGIGTGRAISLSRFAALNAADDVRWRNLPTVWHMTRTFFPWGIGFGAFDPVFRGFELDRFLVPTYFNNAHDDLLETVLTGGLAAAAVLAAFLVWLMMRIGGVVRRGGGEGLDRPAAVMIPLVLASSLVDYPLRTGLMSMVFALACCWLAAPAMPVARQRHGRSAAMGGA